MQRTALILLLFPALLLSCRALPQQSEAQQVGRSEAERGQQSEAQQLRALALGQGFAPLAEPARVRPALVELGRALAFDKILSGNRDISCMTCHSPRFAGGDGRRLPVGSGGRGVGVERVLAGGEIIGRHTPALFNLHALENFFWDGRIEIHGGRLRTPAGGTLGTADQEVFEFGPLSAVAMFPVVSRAEMRGYSGNALAELPDVEFRSVWRGIMDRLASIREYRRLFEAAYPSTGFERMTFAHASNAIAGFLISELAFTQTPWDSFLAGDDNALSETELAGARHFLEAACAECHSGPALSDDEFHNVALAQFGPGVSEDGDDRGRFDTSGEPQDRYAFRTPPLRNVELTGPYGHAGQFESLRGFIGHYGESAQKLRAYDEQLPFDLRTTLRSNWRDILTTRDPLLEGVRFDARTVDELVDFMAALTDERSRDLSYLVPESVPSGLPIDR